MRRIASPSPLFTLTCAFAALALGSLGCSAQALDAGTTTTTDSGTRPADDGGGSLGTNSPGGDGGDGGVPVSGKRTGLQCDEAAVASCNDDVAQSSLAGTCVAGRCKCNGGAQLVPGGKCRNAKGVGSSCTQTTDCYQGLECLEFTVHPSASACSVVGKQCTSPCNDSDPMQSNHCATLLGPGVLCFAGCSGSAGICGQTP